jgi:hypothetical protein
MQDILTAHLYHPAAPVKWMLELTEIKLQT